MIRSAESPLGQTILQGIAWLLVPITVIPGIAVYMVPIAGVSSAKLGMYATALTITILLSLIALVSHYSGTSTDIDPEARSNRLSLYRIIAICVWFCPYFLLIVGVIGMSFERFKGN